MGGCVRIPLAGPEPHNHMWVQQVAPSRTCDQKSAPMPSAQDHPPIRGLTATARRLDTSLTVLEVFGVVDVLSAPDLAEHINRELSPSRTPSALIIDLSGVELLAAAGLTVLVTAKDAAPGATAAVVAADGSPARRCITLTGVDDIIPLYATVGDAKNGLKTI